MSLDLSYDDPYCFSFGPDTPPDYSYELALAVTVPTYVPPAPAKRKRQESHYCRSPSYSQSPGPETPKYSQESVASVTHIATPRRTPVRTHGPQLLPKIRTQDQIDITPTPLPTAKRIKTSTAGGWKPGHGRSFTNPETAYMPALTPGHSRNTSTLCSPISMAGSSVDAQLNHMPNFRRASSVSSGLDGNTVAKFGYPTYRNLPTYIPSAVGIETFQPPTFCYTPQHQPREPSPMCNSISFEDFTNEDFDCAEDLALDFDADVSQSIISPVEPTTSLKSYLTAPNPSPSLVRQLNVQLREPGAKHFWWDIRQIRPWTSFNTETISQIPGLSDLLNVDLPLANLPTPSTQRNAQPETETELLSLYKSYYADKLNTALAVGMGGRHIAMKTVAPSSDSANVPHFVSNYTDDTSSIVYNRPSGRVVGLVLSFDRWNSSMRVEGNHRKVSYLRALARLHGAMREYECRYGFIMTEIELLVVRNGSDATPNFGFLEVHSIPLAECSSSRSRTVSPDGTEYEDELAGHQEEKMTAMLALFYLHMLAKDVPLANQPHYSSAIGAPAEGTRRKHLPKDTWMPEPQVAEKREAKRARGWVWPDEAVGRKELGKRGVRYAKC